MGGVTVDMSKKKLGGDEAQTGDSPASHDADRYWSVLVVAPCGGLPGLAVIVGLTPQAQARLV